MLSDDDARQHMDYDRKGMHLEHWTIQEFLGVLEDLSRLNPDILLDARMTLGEISLSRKALITRGRSVEPGSNLEIALWNRNLI